MSDAAVGRRLGPYELQAVLGAGGMGEVWKARDTRLDRTVAIKFSHAAFTDRFQREARAIAALNHPNIATLHDVGDNYLVMEYVDGEPLRTPAGTRKLVELSVQIAEGLAAAHSAGIVHRDLKPGNILVNRSGQVKILDFGLAKQVKTPNAAGDVTMTAVTEAGAVLGTVIYMSPEQVRGADTDHRSDIFSLGVVLYELVCGSRPFDRATPVETMHAILKEDPPDLPESVPPSIRQVIVHALEKQPERRFQSAQDLAFALRMSVTATGSSPVIQAGTRIARRTWLGAGTAVAAAAMTGAGGYWLRGREPARAQASFRMLTHRDGVVGDARFTNDGGVVYMADWDEAPRRLYYLGAGETVARELQIDGAGMLASVSAKNELAVILKRGWTLARVPLSGGAPRELLADVFLADHSPDGESLAVLQRAGTKNSIQYPIGNTLQEPKFPPYSLRVSPSGDLVAYTGSGSSGFRGSAFKLAVLDRRGKETILASWQTEGHNFSTACWTPDGRELWLESPLLSEPGTIYAVDLASRKKRVVTTLPGFFVPQAIAAGKKLLLRQQRLREGLRGRLAGGVESDFTWGDRTASVLLSQDGTFCAFLSIEQKQVAYLRRMDGTPAVRLGDGGPISISPDGKWVQLFRTGGDIRSVLVPTGPGQEKPFQIESLTLRTAEIVAWLPEEQYLVNGHLASGRPADKTRRFFMWKARSRELIPVGPDMAFDSLYHSFVDPQATHCLTLGTDGKWVLFPLQGGEPRTFALSANQHPAGFTADGRGAWIARSEAAMDGVATRVDRLDFNTARIEPGFQLQVPHGMIVNPQTVKVTPDGKSYVYVFRSLSSELSLAEGIG